MKKILLLLIIFFAGNCCFANDISVNHTDGIYHIILKGNAIKKKVNFIASDALVTNKEMHKTTGSRLTVNTGFFDPNNQKTISYIVTNGHMREDPVMNESLMSNPVLRMNLEKILNRTEFRVVECDRKWHYEITSHNTPVEFGCSLVTSAQGGPQLLPSLRLEEEFFILKDKDGNIIRQSASVLDKTARTIFGIKDGNLHILIITNENPKTIFEAQELCKMYGFEYAMAFDGGSSTSLNYKNLDIVSTDDAAGRMLKSFMIIKKPPKDY
jgi:exopolysaccharide biosynthesis protein